jgi:SAM-dependent methyltransferase
MKTIQNIESEHRLFITNQTRGRTAKTREAILWEKNNEDIFNFIEQNTGDLKDQVCLELGSGPTGLHSYFSIRNVPVIEGDLIMPALVFVKATNPDRVRPVCLDATNLPFRDKSLDLVFCVGLLHHLESIPSVIHEMIRCLKPTGLVVIVEPNRGYFPVALMWMLPRKIVNTIRRNILPRLLPAYPAAADYERPLFVKEIITPLNNLGYSDYTEMFNVKAPPYFPRLFRIVHTFIIHVCHHLPGLSNKALSWQFMIAARRV